MPTSSLNNMHNFVKIANFFAVWLSYSILLSSANSIRNSQSSKTSEKTQPVFEVQSEIGQNVINLDSSRRALYSIHGSAISKLFPNENARLMELSAKLSPPEGEFNVQIPTGTIPGHTFSVELDGQMVTLTAPMDKKAGEFYTVTLPHIDNDQLTQLHSATLPQTLSDVQLPQPRPIEPKLEPKLLPEQDLPDGWKAILDPTSNEAYYWNTVTEEVTWDKPGAKQQVQAQVQPIQSEEHQAPAQVQPVQVQVQQIQNVEHETSAQVQQITALEPQLMGQQLMQFSAVGPQVQPVSLEGVQLPSSNPLRISPERPGAQAVQEMWQKKQSLLKSYFGQSAESSSGTLNAQQSSFSPVTPVNNVQVLPINNAQVLPMPSNQVLPIPSSQVGATPINNVQATPINNVPVSPMPAELNAIATTPGISDLETAINRTPEEVVPGQTFTMYVGGKLVTVTVQGAAEEPTSQSSPVTAQSQETASEYSMVQSTTEEAPQQVGYQLQELQEQSEKLVGTLPEGWLGMLDATSGQPYYWNTATNEVSWEKPKSQIPQQEERTYAGPVKEEEQSLADSFPVSQQLAADEPTSQESPVVVQPKEIASEYPLLQSTKEELPPKLGYQLQELQERSDELDGDLPEGWLAIFDSASGRPYFWNLATNEVSWDKPLSPTAQKQQQPFDDFGSDSSKIAQQTELQPTTPIQPVAEPALEKKYSVQIPENKKPGETFTVQIEGMLFSIAVPSDKKPGELVTFALPSTSSPQAAIPSTSSLPQEQGVEEQLEAPTLPSVQPVAPTQPLPIPKPEAPTEPLIEAPTEPGPQLEAPQQPPQSQFSVQIPSGKMPGQTFTVQIGDSIVTLTVPNGKQPGDSIVFAMSISNDLKDEESKNDASVPENASSETTAEEVAPVELDPAAKLREMIISGAAKPVVQGAKILLPKNKLPIRVPLPLTTTPASQQPSADLPPVSETEEPSPEQPSLPSPEENVQLPLPTQPQPQPSQPVLEQHTVQIPQGFSPGQTFTAQINGMSLSLTVPEGNKPGDSLTFFLPATTPVTPQLSPTSTIEEPATLLSTPMPLQSQPPDIPQQGTPRFQNELNIPSPQPPAQSIPSPQPPTQEQTQSVPAVPPQFSVQIPSGLGPGQTFTVQVDGAVLSLTVPSDKKSGDPLVFSLPPQPAQMTDTFASNSIADFPEFKPPAYTAPVVEKKSMDELLNALEINKRTAKPQTAHTSAQAALSSPIEQTSMLQSAPPVQPSVPQNSLPVAAVSQNSQTMETASVPQIMQPVPPVAPYSFSDPLAGGSTPASVQPVQSASFDPYAQTASAGLVQSAFQQQYSLPAPQPQYAQLQSELAVPQNSLQAVQSNPAQFTQPALPVPPAEPQASQPFSDGYDIPFTKKQEDPEFLAAKEKYTQEVSDIENQFIEKAFTSEPPSVLAPSTQSTQTLPIGFGPSQALAPT